MNNMSFTVREDLSKLIPAPLLEEVFIGATENSAVMSTFRRLPNMSSGTLDMAVNSMLPIAYWQTGDYSQKNITKTGWENKRIYAEEIAVIVPIPDNVRRDSSIDIWQQMMPQLSQAIGQKVDEAVLMGVGKPSRFRADLITSIYSAGANISATTNLYSDINTAMSKVEMSGYDPTAIMSDPRMKSAFRMLLDTTGQPIRGTEIDSIPKYYVKNGVWDYNKAKFIVGDFSQAMYAVRQDIEVMIGKEGSFFDPNTNETVHMFQQDMQALRLTFRIGWEIPNPVNPLNGTTSRFPFALIENTTPVSLKDVAFTVTDGVDPIQGATVRMGDLRGTTDASGEATVKAQANQNYKYSVSKRGLSTVRGDVAVGANGTSVAVVLN
jgi:HK97 family phage major capsid protein